MKIGRINRLKVARSTSVGMFLEDDMGIEVLLPKRYVPDGLQTEQEVEVFIYRDSEDRLIATTETPKGFVDETARLEVTAVTQVGAFLDWGLPKDLFVPMKEQEPMLNVGEKAFVFIYLDDLTQRLVASNRLEKHLHKVSDQFGHGDKVGIIVWKSHELGYQVVIEGLYLGMVYHNQTFTQLKEGAKMVGWVNQVREDGKLDILLQKPGFAFIDDASEIILSRLKEHNGFLALHDNSSPEQIKDTLEMSKKAFKKAVGGLYKAGRIVLEEDGIRLK